MLTFSFPWRADRLPVGYASPPFWWRTVSLSRADAQHHMHVLGVTGSGKSRFLGHWFLTLLNAGLPVTLIDPHGDLSALILSHLVRGEFFTQLGAFERLVYLDLPAAARQGRYLPLNVLAQGYDAHTTARVVLEALRRTWPSLEGGVAPTFENIVLAGTSVLIQHRLPLPLLHDLLVDKAWRDRLLTEVADRQVVSFFKERFDRWGREQPLLIESSLRRIFLLAFSPVLRYSLSQERNVLAYREIFRRRQSVIINLALPDPDARRLLGCLLTVGIEQAALSLADVPPHERPGSHHLVIDEFSEVSSQSEEALGRILALTRKFGLCLVLSHQMWDQASLRLRGALQNVGVDVAFRLGRADAEVSAPLFGRANPLSVKHQVRDPQATKRTHPTFYSLPEQREEWVQMLTDLPDRHALVRTQSGSITHLHTVPFPDVAVDRDRLAQIQERYLQTYFQPQATIEQALARQKGAVIPATRRRERLAAA